MTVAAVEQEMQALRTQLESEKVKREDTTKTILELKTKLTDMLQQQAVLSVLEGMGISTEGVKVSEGKIVQTAPR